MCRLVPHEWMACSSGRRYGGWGQVMLSCWGSDRHTFAGRAPIASSPPFLPPFCPPWLFSHPSSLQCCSPAARCRTWLLSEAWIYGCLPSLPLHFEFGTLPGFWLLNPKPGQIHNKFPSWVNADTCQPVVCSHLSLCRRMYVYVWGVKIL